MITILLVCSLLRGDVADCNPENAVAAFQVPGVPGPACQMPGPWFYEQPHVSRAMRGGDVVPKLVCRKEGVSL